MKFIAMERVFIGNGGHTDEVEAQMGVKYTRFVDDQYYNNEYGVLPLSKLNPKRHIVMVTIGDSVVRNNIIEKLPPDISFFSYVHPTALLMGNNIKIGVGSFIGAYSILTTNIELGDFCILNRSVHIGHGCKIGNYFSAMPGVIVSGDVSIGNNVYVGTNSSIKEKIKICDNVTIGMQCAVYKNIDNSGIYVGSSFKKLQK